MAWTFLFILPLIDLQAVIISSGDGSGNTTAPADDPGWSNVGQRGSLSGVYLGNRWVLTGFHVGAGTLTLDGTPYAAEPGTSVRLTNPGGLGLSANTDLLMYQLSSDPLLPSLIISSSIPATGTDVTLIGNGRNRAATKTFWDDATNPWTETVELGSDQEGFKWSAGRTMRWGENAIGDVGGNVLVNVDAGFGNVISFFTVFDEAGKTHEAQAATGDSGGAMFIKNGASWELAGIILAISSITGQPGSTAVFGNSTFSASLPFYRDQINAIMAVPEPHEWMAITAIACLGLFWLKRRRSSTETSLELTNP